MKYLIDTDLHVDGFFMEYVARGVVLNNQNKILLVKHTKGGKRTLPGGHVDSGEDFVHALRREIFEEFSLHVEVVGSHHTTIDPAVEIQPLPFCVQEVSYIHAKTNEPIHNLEMRYFAQVVSGKISVDEREIAVRKRFTHDEILSLGATKVFQSVLDGIEQNRDLLELVR